MGEEIQQLADIAPASAISKVWADLEDRVRAVAGQAGVEQQLFPEILRGLIAKGMIQASTADGILGLRNLRNLAVHAPEERLTSARAIEFITMADAIAWSLERDLRKAS